MQAPTHATFSLVFVILAGTGLGLGLTPATAAFAILGALCPDIDTPMSWIGRLARPLAARLERRFGHRTVTHSVLGLALATLLFTPLAFLNPHWPVAFALGYLSHLLIDAVNKSGTPLFYPSPLRAVFPGYEARRITVGSPAETVLLGALIVVLVLLLPLHQMGFTRALHALTRTTAGAITDFRAWQGRHEVWADVEGTFQPAGRRVSQRYRVLGIANESTLVVLDPTTQKIHAVGTSQDANIYPATIRAHAGQAITVETRQVTLTQRLLRDLLREVPPDGETFLHGTVKTTDAVLLKPDPEQYEVLKPGLHALELRYARPRDLKDPQVGTLFVVSGLVLVQTIRPADPAMAVTGPSAAEPAQAPEFDDVTELFITHVTDRARELLVHEGDRIAKGQLLARLTWRDPELERRREHAEAVLEEKQATLTLEARKVRLARALVQAQLAVSDAAAREEAALLHAQEAVAQARREVDRLAEEARRAREVRAPVDGQVLTLRVHVIHGSEGTAMLRLLYARRGGDRMAAGTEGLTATPERRP
jgi:inner membrane protein